MNPPSIAVLIPCQNEESAIVQVISAFQAALPTATIYVYDNNSRDRTVEVAKQAGARVFHETMQGKGNVVRRMFSDIEADVYVLVDGDDTYRAESAPLMVKRLLAERLDMVNGTRVTQIAAAYRRGHRMGNTVLSWMVRRTFGNRITDMLSGYRVFSRRFVKSFPALSSGFETERPQGGSSKLRTYSDGLRILRTIVMLVKDERPLLFFSIASLAFFVASIGLSIPIFAEFRRTHLVPRFPTAILSTGLMMLSFLLLVCGLVLDSVARGRKELRRLIYLSLSLWQGEID